MGRNNNQMLLDIRLLLGLGLLRLDNVLHNLRLFHKECTNNTAIR